MGNTRKKPSQLLASLGGEMKEDVDKILGIVISIQDRQNAILKIVNEHERYMGEHEKYIKVLEGLLDIYGIDLKLEEKRTKFVFGQYVKDLQAFNKMPSVKILKQYIEGVDEDVEQLKRDVQAHFGTHGYKKQGGYDKIKLDATSQPIEPSPAT